MITSTRKIFTTLVLLSICFMMHGQSDAPFIIVDQFGYLPGAPKIAVIKDPQVGFDSANSFSPGNTYAIVNALTGDTVLTGAPVAWKNGTTDTSSGDRVWHFDFSDVTANGSYYVLDVDQEIRSYQFNISPSVYNEAFKHAFRTFFYQRSGFAKEVPYAEPAWVDGASHIGPGQDKNARVFNDKHNEATERDVSGGWYDAGDYNKYTRWNGSYIVDMMLAYIERPEVWTDDFGIPESGNGIPDILDEAKWGIDHLLRMQLDNGSVLSVVGASHASPPSAATGQSLYGSPNTSGTLSVSGALALASSVYSSIGMIEYASLLEEKAILAWDWADANPDVLFRNNDPAYGSSGLAAGQQETNDYGRLTSKLRAACFLFELTGEEKYRDFFDANYDKVNMFQWNFAFPFQSDNQDMLLYYTTLDGATQSVADHIFQVYGNAMKTGSENWPAISGFKDPYMAHMKDYTWGSNGVKCRQGGMYYNLLQYDLEILDSNQITDAAIGFINYIHGVNPLNLNYLSNMFRFGANNGVREFYHTWFRNGSAKWDRVGVSEFGPAPGFLTGGPNPSYNWDGCCPTACGSTNNNQLCYSESITPPKGQPAQKSYKDFNTSWPLNSWSVTENSLGYQLPYLRLLSKFVDPSYDCNGDPDGDAYIDACGICSGGNTGRTGSSDPDDCAVFELDVSSVNGTVSVSLPKDTYINGEFITLRALADSGYIFAGWSGHAHGHDNPLTVVMNSNKDIKANFVKTYTLTVNNGSGSGDYDVGKEVAITADSPDEGMLFDAWTGDTDYVDTVANSSAIITMPAKDITVTATYKDQLFTLTVNNGSGSGDYAAGTDVAIAADSPDEGMIFDEWTGDVEFIDSISKSSATLIMPSKDIAVTATFTADTLNTIGPVHDGTGLSLSLYPNPADRLVKLAARGFDADAVVSIVCINGTVMMREILDYTGEMIINTAPLPTGMYFVRVSSKDRQLQIRLIVI
jgi:endoglucanase